MFQQIVTAKIKRTIKDAFLFTYPKVKVKTNQGTVKGCIEKLPNGRKYFRFSGIPYAQSPIGQLRFKSPKKLLKFESEELDCTRERSCCFQKSIVSKRIIGSEDCLNLNVYTPADMSSEKLPVMVFIHGGAFIFDSNSVDFYSPDYLLMNDVIVVTINYRLHAFGFLSLPSMGITGNAGLKDQQMALEWVYENISNFNGNPEKICLFGESAGGSCVYLHALSSKSGKLFKSAICQSGSPLDIWLFQNDGEEKTRKMGKILGAKGDSDKDIYEALLNATPEALLHNQVHLENPNDHGRKLPFLLKPIIEKESDDAFITQNPLELMKNKAGQLNIPMMLGNASGDGMTITKYFLRYLKMINEDKVRMIPENVNIDRMSEEAISLGERISQFYFGEKGVTYDKIPQFINLMNDTYFNIPRKMNVRIHQIYQPNITQFLYEFDFVGKLNFMKSASKMTKYPGSCHFDDMSYLFRHQIIDVKVSKDSREYKMREKMCKLWTNFAKYSNPTPKNHNPLTVDWEPVKPNDKDLKYMILSENPRVEKNLYLERLDFWESVYNKYNGSFLSPKFDV